MSKLTTNLILQNPNLSTKTSMEWREYTLDLNIFFTTLVVIKEVSWSLFHNPFLHARKCPYAVEISLERTKETTSSFQLSLSREFPFGSWMEIGDIQKNLPLDQLWRLIILYKLYQGASGSLNSLCNQ